VRQCKYIFGAVCPNVGHLDYLTADDMNTDNMSRFLKQVSNFRHKKLIIIVLDGDSAHTAEGFVISSNVSLIILPPYSPEL
jgi:transposase